MISFKGDEVTIINDVLNLYECGLLNKWVFENKNKEFFKKSKLEIGENRKTTRGSNEISFDFPDIIYKTYDNLKTKLKLDDFMVHPNGSDGVVCSISYTQGILKKHKDPKLPNHESLHLLIKTSGTLGGNLVINDQEYDLNIGDCLCFFSSINEHSVTEYLGLEPRITWFCSIQIPKEMITY